MPKQVILTTAAPVPISPISQATRAGGFVYTQGILGRSVEGTLAEGMEGQGRQIMENLKAILAAAGAGLEDVLRMEVFVTDLTQMATFNAIFREYFPEQPPARIGMEVTKVGGDALIEVTATAYVGA